VQQNFDRIKMWIDRWRQRFPVIRGRSHKNGAGSVAFNLVIELSGSKFQVTKMDEREGDDCAIGNSRCHQPLLPLVAPDLTLPLFAPRLWKKIKPGGCGWRFHCHHFGRRRQRLLDFVTQAKTFFVYQHILKRRADTL
jgi:hypothetical protein